MRSQRAAASQGTQGRRYQRPRRSQDQVFTDDEWRIPLTGRSLEVFQGAAAGDTADHSRPRRLPDEPARGHRVSQSWKTQQWSTSCCPSTHRSGAFAHYYTFDINKEQTVSIEAASPTVDLYLYLLSGAAKTGNVIAENDDLSPGESLASGLERRLSAGTYTAEVTTNQTGEQNGSFSLTVQAPAPTPTPTPTPTQSQEPPAGVRLLEWPPFVAILEMPGYSVGVNGVVHTPREVRRLVWNSPTDWKMTVLSAESVTLPDETVNTTGIV